MLIALLLIGCRTENRFVYDLSKSSFMDNNLKIFLGYGYGPNYEVDGMAMIDYGYPLLISFSYVTTDEAKLDKLEIEDFQIIDVKNNNVVFELNKTVSKVETYKEKKVTKLSIPPLDKENLSYQNYILKAKVLVYKSADEVVEEDIEVLLETNFNTNKRWDWFDKIMSV